MFCINAIAFILHGIDDFNKFAPVRQIILVRITSLIYFITYIWNISLIFSEICHTTVHAQYLTNNFGKRNNLSK